MLPLIHRTVKLALTLSEGVSARLAVALLDDEWNGLAVDFRDNSYAMRDSSEAEILLDGENGLALALPQDEYAMRT